jgi:hypothetical protein
MLPATRKQSQGPVKKVYFSYSDKSFELRWLSQEAFIFNPKKLDPLKLGFWQFLI